MSKKFLSEEDVALLKRNKNVANCSNKSITYSNEFKVTAVKQYKEGLPSREIFEKAGFDLNLLGKKAASNCLKRWNKIVRKKGIESLRSETRGRGSPGRPKLKGITDKERLEYCEAKIAYLKAENDFLKQLRKKKGLR